MGLVTGMNVLPGTWTWIIQCSSSDKVMDGVGRGESWYSNVQVPSDFLQVSPKRCVFIRLCKLVLHLLHAKEWKMERSQKWVEKSDLWLILVVASYNQRVLWYHLVAIRPQTVKSLCISVIPRSVILTHTVHRRIYSRVAITHLLHQKVSRENLLQ